LKTLDAIAPGVFIFADPDIMPGSAFFVCRFKRVLSPF
jgi:hypothetical protein